MDAIGKYSRVVYVLLLERGLIIVLLAAFYAVAAFLAIVLDSAKTANVILIMAAIPACGLAAIASERVSLCSADCAILGVPSSARILRNGQVVILGLIVGVPICLALLYGAKVDMAALLIIPAAFGTLLVQRGRWSGIVWIVLVVGANVFPTASQRLVSAAAVPTLRWVAIVVGVVLLHRWLGLAERIRKRTVGHDLSPIDRRLETAAVVTGAPSLTQRQIDKLGQAYDQEIDQVGREIADGRITYKALAVGLSIVTTSNWRGWAQTVGIAWAILCAAHFGLKPRFQQVVFIWMIISAAGALFSRLGTIRLAWHSFAAEESLLLLTPKWPNAESVKRFFLKLMLRNQTGAWIGWVLVIAPFIALGWIGLPQAEISIVLLLSVSSGSSGALLFALSRPHHEGISISTIGFLVCAVVGVATFLFGSAGFPHARWAGIALILVPLLWGGLSFVSRPLQFPVQVIYKSASRGG
jgi:hypothetical protein